MKVIKAFGDVIVSLCFVIMERTFRWIAWHLPKMLVLWCYTRVASFASMADDKAPQDIDLMRGLEIWGNWCAYGPRIYMVPLVKILVVGGFAVIMASLFLVSWWLSFCGVVMLLLSIPMINSKEVQRWLSDSQPENKGADVE